MGIEPQIKFTVEREKDGILPFMDIHIRREKDKLVTKVYRKDTHKQISKLEIQSLKEFSVGNCKRPNTQGSLLL